MLTTHCDLCGTEIKGDQPDYHHKPRIEEERKAINGQTVKVMLWIECKVLLGSICVDCKQMYIEKLLTALATSKKAPKS